MAVPKIAKTLKAPKMPKVSKAPSPTAQAIHATAIKQLAKRAITG